MILIKYWKNKGNPLIVAPADSTELEKADIEYLESIEKVFSKLNDSLIPADDNLEDYKALMESIEIFIQENYREYFLKHYQDTTAD